MNSAQQINPLAVSFNKTAALIVALALIAAPLLQIGVSTAFAATDIPNGSLNAHTVTTNPTGWSPAGFDGAGPITDKAVFSYVAGRNATSSTDTTDMAVMVQVNSAITGGGDAKWVSDVVTDVTPGVFYTFSNWYKSTVTSFLIAEYTHTGGAVDYHPLATLDPTSGDAWTQTVQDFDVPSDVSAIRVFHTLQSVGSLTTDDYALTTGAPTSGAFDFPMISVTFDDGWTSQYENALPKLQSVGIPATFYVMSTSTVAASYDLIAVQSAEVGGTVASTSAIGTSWAPIFRDPTTMKYRFSDLYQGDASSVVVTYVLMGGATTTQTFSLPAAVIPTRSGIVFDLPATAIGTPIEISHTADAGALSVTEGSLMVYVSGYMNSVQLKDILSITPGGKNNEIGNHTEDHCSLSRILAGDSSICAFTPGAGATATSEVNNATNVLEAMLNTTINSLAYPFGEYNSGVKSVVTAGGLQSARTVDAGYNRKTSDKLALKVQNVDTTTSLAELQGWIQNAITNNLWLILVFHQVDDPATLTSNGETGGVSTANFEIFMNELQAHSAQVNFMNVRDALAFMGTVTPTDTVAPVITLSGVSPVSVTVGTTYTDAGATATDNVDPSVTVVTTGSVDTATIGSYTLHYNATDVALNPAIEVTRTVNVVAATPAVDATAPVIAAHANIKVVATSTSGLVVDYTAPTFTDAAPISGSAVCNPAAGTNFALGTSTVTCVATDTAGNHATSTFTVEVFPVGAIISTQCSDGVDNDGDGLTDTKDPGCYATLNASDTGSYSADDNDETNVLEAVTTPITSGGGGGGNGPIFGGSLSFPGSTGQVLGTSTSPTVPPPACPALLTKLIKYAGAGNDSNEVKKFQNFLNKAVNAGLPETGFFGKLTRAALHTFQTNNATQILSPWGLLQPTDNVGVNTRAVANALNCTL